MSYDFWKILEEKKLSLSLFSLFVCVFVWNLVSCSLANGSKFQANKLDSHIEKKENNIKQQRQTSLQKST